MCVISPRSHKQYWLTDFCFLSTLDVKLYNVSLGQSCSNLISWEKKHNFWSSHFSVKHSLLIISSLRSHEAVCWSEVSLECGCWFVAGGNLSLEYFVTTQHPGFKVQSVMGKVIRSFTWVKLAVSQCRRFWSGYTTLVFHDGHHGSKFKTILTCRTYRWDVVGRPCCCSLIFHFKALSSFRLFLFRPDITSQSGEARLITFIYQYLIFCRVVV